MKSLSIKDLSFINKISPEMGDMVIDLFKLQVEGSYQVMTSSEEECEKYLGTLTQESAEEVITFYESVLETFTEREMYEDCVKVHYVIESIKLFQDKVAF